MFEDNVFAMFVANAASKPWPVIATSAIQFIQFSLIFIILTLTDVIIIVISYKLCKENTETGRWPVRAVQRLRSAYTTGDVIC